MKRVGVDVGGTFTDLIYVDDEAGEIAVHKLATTPADPRSAPSTAPAADRGGRAGGLGARPGLPRHHDRHQHRDRAQRAQVGMLTSEGYRDILHIARHKKPLNFSNYQDLPWQAFPIVRRRYRLPIAGRIDKDGSVLRDIDEAEIREQVQKLKKAEVEAVAVCLLFSFLNNEHEARVAEIVREEMPDTFVSVSSEVLPQYREYERFSTVALNAFVGPKVSRYVGRLQDSLAELGVKSGLHLMTSASGVATTEVSLSRPVNLLMSGPVAGVVGGIWAGRQAGFGNVITLDVGGTSADIGLAQDGKLRMKHLLDTKVGPYQAMVPMVDVDTIGAGGGSIVYVDHGGIFRVGPRSAGADPGPACYMRGGTEPTSTDAMVNLGWLRAETFLGGGDGGQPRPRARFVQRGFADAGDVDRGGLDGGDPDPQLADGAGDRAELGAQGLRPARLRARGRGRRRAVVLASDRRERGHPVRARAAISRHHLGDGAARHGHGLRVRLHGLRAHVGARRGGAAGVVRGARAPGSGSARGGRRGRREHPGPAHLRVPLPRPGLRAASGRARPAPSTPPGPSRSATRSTRSTSASTRAASRTPTSRSRTSACAGSVSRRS